MRFLAATLAILFLTAGASAQRSGPPVKLAWRNTFLVATESVLDQATSLDLNTEAAAFDPGFATLKTAQRNLEDMASDEQEQNVVSELKNMVFRLSSCRIQAIDGTDISGCLLKLAADRKDVMLAIHRHKENGAWTDGDPRP